MPDSKEAPMPIAHFTLATRDVERTASFFMATLGCRRIDRAANIPMPAAWLALAPDQEIHILEVPDFEPSAFEREYGRHIALFHPHADFPALKERLTRHGAELIASRRETPVERFFFKDPNGYIFEVIANE